jgi:hypothetical protein
MSRFLAPSTIPDALRPFFVYLRTSHNALSQLVRALRRAPRPSKRSEEHLTVTSFDLAVAHSSGNRPVECEPRPPTAAATNTNTQPRYQGHGAAAAAAPREHAAGLCRPRLDERLCRKGRPKRLWVQFSQPETVPLPSPPR